MNEAQGSLVGPAAVDMSGRYAIVTGGSKGIGAGCARALIAAGADVTILARGEESGRATAAALTAEGPGRCDFVAVDVSDLDALAECIRSLSESRGQLDTLVNNAVSFPGWKPVDDITQAVLLETLRVNMGAYFVASQAALPFLRRTRGTIVNLSSLSGELGGWHDALYSSTKGGITAMTRALAVEEAANGVRVNAILPGNILSDARARGEAALRNGQAFHDYIERWQWLGRSGTNEEVGNVALFLASPMASFCTGICVVVSGGLELGYGVKEPYPDFDAG